MGMSECKITTCTKNTAESAASVYAVLCSTRQLTHFCVMHLLEAFEYMKLMFVLAFENTRSEDPLSLIIR